MTVLAGLAGTRQASHDLNVVMVVSAQWWPVPANA